LPAVDILNTIREGAAAMRPPATCTVGTRLLVDERVTLTFTHVDIESSNNCEHDSDLPAVNVLNIIRKGAAAMRPPATCTVATRLLVDERVTLTFTHVDIETSNNCEHDSVKIYDGQDAIGTPRQVVCGSAIPVPLTSYGSALLVRFVSDRSIQRTGFRASYSESASGNK